MLTVILQMRPFAKQRPRFSKGRAHMDAGYKRRKETLGWLYMADKSHPKQPLDGQLSVRMILGFKGKGPRADADNLAGGPMDALNGLLWHDDSQIKNLSITVNRDAPDDYIRIEVSPCV